jgi:hypothetical protein
LSPNWSLLLRFRYQISANSLPSTSKLHAQPILLVYISQVYYNERCVRISDRHPPQGITARRLYKSFDVKGLI